MTESDSVQQMSQDDMDALIAEARALRPSQSALRRLGQKLPSEEEALNNLLWAAVDRYDDKAFTRLLFAAFNARRRVDADILTVGAALLPNPNYIGVASLNCVGDVGGALLRAVISGRMGSERELTALVFAVHWYKKNCENEMPHDLYVQARLCIRDVVPGTLVHEFAAVLAQQLESPWMLADIGEPPGVIESPYEQLISMADIPPLQLFDERGGEVTTHSGAPVRRSVPHIGRNEPCPCGSGKKYKRCCHDKDQERLLHSSEVAGVTTEEIEANRELYLTAEELQSMRWYELARLDPEKMPTQLLPFLIERLQLFCDDDAVFSVFEKVGLREGMEAGACETIVNFLAHQREDLAIKLAALPGAENLDFEGENLELGMKLARAGDEETHLLESIEWEAQRGLQSDRFLTLVNLAYTLLQSRYPALGILVARGLVPFVRDEEGTTLIDDILRARYRLGLSAFDRAEDLVGVSSSKVEQIFNEAAVKELEKTRSEIQGKDRELRKMQNELENVRQEMQNVEKQREKEKQQEADKVELEPAESPVQKEQELAALRGRVRELKSQVKSRHEEKNRLRDELGQVRRQLQQERQGESKDSTTSAVTKEGVSEEDMFEKTDSEGTQPVRYPVFSERFEESITNIPEMVVKKTMRLVGQLAAGDDNAFRGTLKLKQNHDVLRQRVGRDHRLLFRLREQSLVVEVLANRGDMEQVIKRLA